MVSLPAAVDHLPNGFTLKPQPAFTVSYTCVQDVYV